MPWNGESEYYGEQPSQGVCFHVLGAIVKFFYAVIKLTMDESPSDRVRMRREATRSNVLEFEEISRQVEIIAGVQVTRTSMRLRDKKKIKMCELEDI